MAERVILTIGTKKGLFVAEAPKARSRFVLRGPFSPGVAVYSTLVDTRGTLARAQPSATGNDNDWLNEIHPNTGGYGKIAARLVRDL